LNKNKSTFKNPLQRKHFVGYFSELRETIKSYSVFMVMMMTWVWWWPWVFQYDLRHYWL